jgi:LysR family glycine cleavage system transcriptional activator
METLPTPLRDRPRRRLPPFFALRALEAAARHKSYTRAADELAVTHGAVSHQIRRLEAELGARLFRRSGNTMQPSAAALQLASDVAQAISRLHDGVAAFVDDLGREPLVISVEPLFARRWLTARLPRLLAHVAGTNLELRIDDRMANLTADGVDVGIRYGHGRWEGLESQHLLPLVMTPVCSPQLAATHGLRSPRDLLKAPLLHRRQRPWSAWFKAFGLEPPPDEGLVFDDTLMMLEAAAQGFGVALAPAGLIDADLASGRLVRPLTEGVTSEFGIFLVWRRESPKLKRIRALRDWLTAEVSVQTEALAASA